jgi:hypothetical protein
MKEKPIGVTNRYIKKDETIAMVDLLTGEVTSDNMDFLPGGKETLLKMLKPGSYIPQPLANQEKEDNMTNKERLKRIAEIIERVDNRCMAADGPVTPTLQEMEQDEISEIYKLASQSRKE